MNTLLIGSVDSIIGGGSNVFTNVNAGDKINVGGKIRTINLRGKIFIP